VNIVWTIVSTIGLAVLAVAGVVLFEVTMSPRAEQRQMAGNAAFVGFALLALGLWAWHFSTGRAKKKGGK
jgi:hypothetical protein